MGDASAEEDYVLGAMGWASTKRLPILFVVEDNNLSILTEKKVRRSWEMDDVARSFGIKAYDLEDDPMILLKNSSEIFHEPVLLNVRTNRKYWHAGPGIDDENIFDRYKHEMNILGQQAVDIDIEMQEKVRTLWQKQLEKQ